MPVELDIDQVNAVRELKTGKILCGEPGSGKSRTALAYYFKENGGYLACLDERNRRLVEIEDLFGLEDGFMVDSPKDLYIITTAKKRDDREWEAEMLPFLMQTGDFRGDICGGKGVEKDGKSAKNAQKSCPVSVFQGDICENIGQNAKKIDHRARKIEGFRNYRHKVVVDSWNNVQKYAGVTNSFFIFDEQRVVGYGPWAKSFIKITKSNDWILLSATPGDTWTDYMSVFIANGFYSGKNDFLRQHAVWSRWAKYPKIEKFIGVGRLIAQRNDILIKMPVKKHTNRMRIYLECGFDRGVYGQILKKRWDPWLNEPIQQPAQLCYLLRKVVNTDESRVEMVEKLLKEHEKVIIFYNFNYELELLKGCCCRVGRRFWQWNGRIHERIGGKKCGGRGDICENLVENGSQNDENWVENCSKNGSEMGDFGSENGAKMGENWSEKRAFYSRIWLENWLENGEYLLENDGENWDENGVKNGSDEEFKDWVYLVQYTAGCEGWNCIETNVIIFYSQSYSYRQTVQAEGRIDRRNTPFSDLFYYFLVSKSSIDLAIKKALKNKENFNSDRFFGG